MLKIKDNGRTVTVDGKTYKKVKRYYAPLGIHTYDYRETLPSKLSRLIKRVVRK